MRRRLLLGLLVALCIPASAHASDVRVAAFYYPWYGTSTYDGSYVHWSQRDHTPPDNIASSYYPARGLYSSSDSLVVAAQMDEIKGAGIDEIAVSWWGRGSAEDGRLPAVASAATKGGISVAVHIEPYPGRSVASIAADIQYLHGLGITTFYVYRAFDLPVSDWAAAMSGLHAGGNLLFAQTGLVGQAAAAGFDGVYTYDIVTFNGTMFRRYCAEAHKWHLLCAPSVGPGYDAQRGSGDPHVKHRRNGATYDAMWHAAIAAGADRVTITSYNEWHEGTQIEPAANGPVRRDGYRYLTYEGAWGIHGVAAPNAYLARTLYWANVLRKTSAVHPKRRAA